MPFEEQLPEWHAEGVEPPTSKKNTGWQAGEKPPADYWNWQMNRAYKALQELQQKAAEKADVGDMSSVPTTAKDAAGAITELFTSVSDGKALVAGAITDKGVPTSPSDTFQQMADNIGDIPVGPDTSDATVTAGDLRAGKVAYGKDDVRIVGAVPVRAGGEVIPGPSDIVKGAGIYDTPITVKGVPVPADKVLTGTTIAGTAGTMPNRTGHVTGQSISRNGTTLRIRPQQGHYTGASGNSVQWNEPNWKPENIPEDLTMFGLQGTLVRGRKWAEGQVTFVRNGNEPNPKYYVATIAGLDFVPELVVLYQVAAYGNYSRSIIVASRAKDIYTNTGPVSMAGVLYAVSSYSFGQDADWGADGVNLYMPSGGSAITLRWEAFGE